MNRILVIDDDKELCALIKKSILTENIEADCCNNGKDGLEKLRKKEYHLVILDCLNKRITMKKIRAYLWTICLCVQKNCSLSKLQNTSDRKLED